MSGSANWNNYNAFLRLRIKNELNYPPGSIKTNQGDPHVLTPLLSPSYRSPLPPPPLPHPVDR